MLETSQEASNIPFYIHDHATGERFNVITNTPLSPCPTRLLPSTPSNLTLGPNRITHVVLHHTGRPCSFVAASHIPSREIDSHTRRRRGSVTTVSLAERGEEYAGDHALRRFWRHLRNVPGICHRGGIQQLDDAPENGVCTGEPSESTNAARRSGRGTGWMSVSIDSWGKRWYSMGWSRSRRWMTSGSVGFSMTRQDVFTLFLCWLFNSVRTMLGVGMSGWRPACGVHQSSFFEGPNLDDAPRGK